MNPSSPAPLVFFRVLASRGGKPSGLLADLGVGDGAALLPLLASPSFAALGSQFPCFFRADTEPANAAALSQAGFKPIDARTLFRTDERLAAEFLPPSAAWIDGDWWMAPPPKAPGAQAASRALALQLVQLVAADADTHEIEALLRHDPTLSYNLLRLVNSLGMGVGRRVTSFSQAILILGRQQLRRWLNLMLFAARPGDVRSAMLLARVAVRARAIELLAKARGLDKNTQEQGFMTGMFSLLGVLFGMPLSEVLAPLAISEAVQGALLRREGELGALLQLVESAELGGLDDVAAQLPALQLSPAEFNDAVIDAYVWMQVAVRENQGPANG
jgi:EAL and modified HD-GYP domain-containing signal transduction protein